MKVLGLDFTSAPTPRKPITLATCEFSTGVLDVRAFRTIPDFAGFEAVLASEGPWIAGIDFPFGQPRRLVENIGWPATWAEYVAFVAAGGKEAFERGLAEYRAGRAKGDKQHLRAIDALADSRSPMMLAGVPVGKMFFQGAPRLLASGCSVLPMRPAAETRVVVEAYPALVARRWAGKRGYKADERRKQTAEKEAARRAIVARIRSEKLAEVYGFRLSLPDDLAEQFIADPTADQLDSVLCAIQAAWAFEWRDAGYGIPARCDVLEGWIVDPGMVGR